MTLLKTLYEMFYSVSNNHENVASYFKYNSLTNTPQYDECQSTLGLCFMHNLNTHTRTHTQIQGLCTLQVHIQSKSPITFISSLVFTLRGLCASVTAASYSLISNNPGPQAQSRLDNV